MGHLLSALLMAVPLFICSCTVKEDRMLCPCYTYVDLSKYIDLGHKKALMTVMSGAQSVSEEIDLLDYEDSPYEIALPKGTNRISVISGMKNSRVREDSLVTPYGFSSDALWVYNEKFICVDDTYHIEAVPYKNYCMMTIIVVGLLPGQDYDFSFRVIAACNALNLFDSEALDGKFCGLATKSDTEGLFTICLPRQKSNELLLEICRKTSDDEIETVHCIRLNDKLNSEGYDWSRKDLQDVNVIVDYSSFELTLDVVNWTNDDNYIDVEI